LKKCDFSLFPGDPLGFFKKTPKIGGHPPPIIGIS